MTQAYPLQWPAGQPRTPKSQRTKHPTFQKSQSYAQHLIISEIQRLKARNVVISTNIPIRKDGLPYTNIPKSSYDEPGVAVYFSLNGDTLCVACDKWDNVCDNMTSIHKTIEALRGIERWGSGHMMKQAFSGFAALPAPPQERNWWDVLQVPPDAGTEVINAKYRQLARDCHPDNGGSHDQMAELNRARDKALYGRS